jgi:hypothetical protein
MRYEIFMTIKLVVLKSGEDLISDVHEMVYGEDENSSVIGYFLVKPCTVKMKNHDLLSEETSNAKKIKFNVTLFPWIPFTTDERIPIPSDWVVTIVNPTENLKEMYIEDVLNYGKNDQDSSTGEQSNSDQSD